MPQVASVTLDTLTQQIAELTATVQSGGLFDRKKLEAELSAMLTERDAALFKQFQESQPAFRGARVDPEAQGKALSNSNRYGSIGKKIAKDGYARSGVTRVAAADLMLAYYAMQRAHQANPSVSPAPSDDLAEVVKFLDSGSTNAGAEYVPTDLAPTLWEDFFLASRIVAAMNPNTMPSNPYEVPQSMGPITWYKVGAGIAPPTQDPLTAKAIQTATELAANLNWSYSLGEDSIVEMIAAARPRLAQSGAEIMDAFALNADATFANTGNINSDDALPNALDYFLSEGQDGLRHQHLVDNTAQTVDCGGALTDAKLTEAMAKLGKYAADPGKLVFATDISTYLNGFLSTATGAPGNNVITMDKFGNDALVRTGQLAMYRGAAIVVSASYPLTEADGKVSATPANNTKGGVTMFHPDMWRAGFRRELMLEMDRDIQRRLHILVASFREGVACYGPRSSATHTAGLRNITV
jgi:HK97 family phage major capsid protein